MSMRDWDSNEPHLDTPLRATPLDFLQAVYCNEGLPLAVRMKAAIEAAPYFHPKLSVTATVGGRDIAARLEAAIKRSGKIIEAIPNNGGN